MAKDPKKARKAAAKKTTRKRAAKKTTRKRTTKKTAKKAAKKVAKKEVEEVVEETPAVESSEPVVEEKPVAAEEPAAEVAEKVEAVEAVEPADAEEDRPPKAAFGAKSTDNAEAVKVPTQKKEYTHRDTVTEFASKWLDAHVKDRAIGEIDQVVDAFFEKKTIIADKKKGTWKALDQVYSMVAVRKMKLSRDFTVFNLYVPNVLHPR